MRRWVFSSPKSCSELQTAAAIQQGRPRWPLIFASGTLPRRGERFEPHARLQKARRREEMEMPLSLGRPTPQALLIIIFSLAPAAPALEGTAAAASGSTARHFRNDRLIMRADLTRNRPHPATISDNLSDLEFGELVWFAPEVSFELLQRCRGKTIHRALSNC